jgi:hypothetical protein
MSKRSSNLAHVQYNLKKRFNIIGNVDTLCNEITAIIKNNKSIFVEYQKCDKSKYERELHMVLFRSKLMYVVYEREVDRPITVLKMSYKIFKYYSNEHKRSLTTVTK